MTLQVQYIIVCVIILAAIFYAAVKFRRIMKSKNPTCSGCDLKDCCSKATKENSCQKQEEEKDCCCND